MKRLVIGIFLGACLALPAFTVAEPALAAAEMLAPESARHTTDTAAPQPNFALINLAVEASHATASASEARTPGGSELTGHSYSVLRLTPDEAGAAPRFLVALGPDDDDDDDADGMRSRLVLRDPGDEDDGEAARSQATA